MLSLKSEKLEKLKKFIEYLVKHIDLVERRIIKKEKIPHCEKMFSVFETYTEWINKGKQNRYLVILGKSLNFQSYLLNQKNHFETCFGYQPHSK